MKRYKKYKDSGVEWIGEIPAGWEVLPFKFFGEVTLGKMLTPEDKGGYVLKPYLRSQNIQIGSVDVSDVKEMWFSDSELVKLRLCEGDLLFNEGGDVGRTSIWKNEIDECYFQNSVNRVRFKNDNQVYFLYLSSIYHSMGHYNSIVNRVSIPHLTKEKLESVIFLRPPLPEQKQIVEFLDTKTALIDALIEKKERKIELLKEYRTALINEAVTKGLNPKAKMKDSGVEWIGEIPSHWYCLKTNKVFQDIGSGTTPASDNIEYYQDGVYKWVTTTDLNEGNMYDTLSKLTELAVKKYPNLILYPSSSIFISMYGGKIGKIGLSNFDSYCNQSVCVLPNNSKVAIKYYYYWFLCNQEQLKLMGRGGGQPNINKEIIKEFPVCKPPLPEQKQIVEVLDEKTGELDRVVEMEQKKITLLKEYRQSLISSVVTGKIDVRPA